MTEKQNRMLKDLKKWFKKAPKQELDPDLYDQMKKIQEMMMPIQHPPIKMPSMKTVSMSTSANPIIQAMNNQLGLSNQQLASIGNSVGSSVRLPISSGGMWSTSELEIKAEPIINSEFYIKLKKELKQEIVQEVFEEIFTQILGANIAEQKEMKEKIQAIMDRMGYK